MRECISCVGANGDCKLRLENLLFTKRGERSINTESLVDALALGALAHSLTAVALAVVARFVEPVILWVNAR